MGSPNEKKTNEVGLGSSSSGTTSPLPANNVASQTENKLTTPFPLTKERVTQDNETNLTVTSSSALFPSSYPPTSCSSSSASLSCLVTTPSIQTMSVTPLPMKTKHFVRRSSPVVLCASAAYCSIDLNASSASHGETHTTRDNYSTSTFSSGEQITIPPPIAGYRYSYAHRTNSSSGSAVSTVVYHATRDPSDAYKKESRFFWSGVVLTLFMSLFSLLALRMNRELRSNPECRARFLYGVATACIVQVILISAASVVLLMDAYGHLSI